MKYVRKSFEIQFFILHYHSSNQLRAPEKRQNNPDDQNDEDRDNNRP